jgi:hypothetical protein
LEGDEKMAEFVGWREKQKQKKFSALVHVLYKATSAQNFIFDIAWRSSWVGGRRCRGWGL